MPPARPDLASHLYPLWRPHPAPQLGQLQVEPAQVAGALLWPVSLRMLRLLPACHYRCHPCAAKPPSVTIAWRGM